MEELKFKIINSLELQGFSIDNGIANHTNDKLVYKDLHKLSKLDGIQANKEFIINTFKKIKPFLRNASDIDPAKIDLELREVHLNTLEADIFKWWNLVWWSVPYQRPYGRQMRFILWDKGHNAPFGLIGLQSPILKMSVRDKALEIPQNTLDTWINQSMQAQRLGALPPYNDLIGGKMVALAVICNEVKLAYLKKYNNQITIIKNRILSPDLLFITTTSAFGRSSIYNRLKFEEKLVAQSLGFTKGTGTFHISEDIYQEIISFLESIGTNVKRSFGYGPSKRVKLLHLGFKALKLPDFTQHNIQREFFLFPFVENLKEVIAGKETPIYFDRPLTNLQEYWLKRWAFRRPVNKENWAIFEYKSYLNEFSSEYKIEMNYGW